MNFLKSNLKSKILEPTALKYFPWKLQHSKPIPTVFETLKNNHFKQLGISRVRKLLKDDCYAFPNQFEVDASSILVKMLDSFPNPEFNDYVTADYSILLRNSIENIKNINQNIRFKLNSTPNININNIHFTYGKYPIPQDYFTQNWFNYISIILPNEHQQFTSHENHTKLLEDAAKDGCYFVIDTTAELDFEFIISNDNGLPLLRESRTFLDVRFTSPHFTPWDEIFELNEEGHWKLAWEWKISDIDNMLAEGERSIQK